jgi:hypothetical protein
VPIYGVYGKLGTGKSKYCVYVAQQVIGVGRRCAGNLDIYLDKLLPSHRKVAYTRIPDKPTARDLFAIGHGNPTSYEEDNNGVLILDELGTWLNARSFQDPERAPLLDWLIHARKYGWDVYLICQNPMQIDRQVRESMMEFTVKMLRFDKIQVPFFAPVLRLLRMSGRMPRFHVAVVKMGMGPEAVPAEKIVFKGNDLHIAYDTRQVFKADPEAVTVTQLHPNYFAEARFALGWRTKLKAFLFPPPRAKPQPRQWPVSVSALPASERWKIAQRLFLGVRSIEHASPSG